MYNCFNTKRIKHLTRLRLGLSNLHDHKFKDGSQNPICSCGLKQPIETMCHLLHCAYFVNEIVLSLNDVLKITKTNNNNNKINCLLVTLHL